jgi:hypothetical protein
MIRSSTLKNLLLVLFALAPLPAAAQSLHETHERIWHPSGKTPMLSYRMRSDRGCSGSTGHHQAGKAPLPARSVCVAAKDKPQTRLAAVERTPQALAAD